MNIVNFCREVFNSDTNTIVRCLNKATTIVYDGKVCLIADSSYIYYFGKLQHVPTVQAYRVAKQNSKLMHNRLFYSTDISVYKNHCILIDDAYTDDGKLYKWVC